jgi:hypothetical protein
VVVGGAAVAGIVVYAYIQRSRDRQPTPEEMVDAAGYVPSDWSPDAYVGATVPGGETFDPQVDRLDVTTNAEWSQRVIDLLEGVGYTREKASATVAKYLSGEQLDATEKLITQTAIAMLGNPPAGALPILSLPSVTGSTPSTPTQTPAPPSLAVRPAVGGPARRYVLSWGSVVGATGYEYRGVYRRIGGIVRHFPPTRHSYTTAVTPPTGHLAFEIRTTRHGQHSPWNRVTVRAA